jgi:hypothetical protein
VSRDAVRGQQAPEPGVRVIALQRVVRIPLTTLTAQQEVETVVGNPGALIVWPGGPDEPPEGPNGFDVLDDGSFLITDPLPQRISEFDSEGKFHRAWKTGFPPDSVTVTPGGLVLVREATTGEIHVFDREGRPQSSQGLVSPQPAEARVLNGKNGTVVRPANQGVLQIRFDRPGLVLLSLESLATDQAGNTYVALESTAGGAAEGINVNKYVRKYSAEGKLLGEITDIPLDYFVTPVDELRVHKGIVYQLMTGSSEVRINVWNTN